MHNMFASRGGFLSQPVAAAGGFGNSLYFPGNGSQFLSRSGAANLINWKQTTGFTIEYWAYINTWPVGSIQPGPGNQDGAGTNYWSFGPSINGMLQFYYWGSGSQYITTGTNVLALNTWHNIAAVYTSVGSATTISLYVDGIQQQIQWNNTGAYASTKTVTNGVTATATVFGMGKYNSTNNILNGYIDNLRVSNINRYSGASYSLATGPFVSDSNTELLVDPIGVAGSTNIPYTGATSGNMTNASAMVTIDSTHANHT